ncbi:hypothetical protein [Picosynechococcus sp. PCC 73109]|uniref:hypothetical protein n=1 Tax=Picosynechococcus sp. PCC 73109 TaxID=374982 RepID=UPI00074580FE|nr:hypothetical protein [Picosynechococcus sp. PCC 73109]AMA09216.1 hypothetical protein AWQ23_07745 [Picosynechococcus sp. PCC 73109]
MAFRIQRKKIHHIVPRLPPAVDGVGDYALSLARQLRHDYDIDTHFIVGDPAWPDIEQIEEFKTTKLATRSTQALLDRLTPSNPVLLHYVGYGYAKRGCPTWLIQALEIWKQQNQQVHLVTMFHEIAASGPMWTSAFWLSGLQRNLAKRLVNVSDRLLTSKQLYAEILQGYGKGRFNEIPSLPVFSNVGEPENPPDLSKRDRHLVIFGGRSKRAGVYQSSLDQLKQICSYLDIEQIIDIGPKLDAIPTHIGDVPITATGSLPSDEVSGLLSKAIAGFFNYSPPFLGKSGIFAAYCAHRMLPVSAQMTSHIEDGLYPGQHYLLPDQYSAGAKDGLVLQAIADKSHAWYQSHNLANHVKVYQELLFI